MEGHALKHPFISRSDAQESRAYSMSDYLAWRATYVGAESTGERGLVNSSGFTKLLHPACPRAFKATAMPLYCRDGFLQDCARRSVGILPGA
jgi:hypothetical protein